LKLVNIPPKKDVQRLEPDDGVIASTAGAIADASAVGAKVAAFVFAFLVILQAVSTVLSLADVLIFFISIESTFLEVMEVRIPPVFVAVQESDR
jgi:uncharacterized membrane protein YcaP (DUF421 family)